MKNYTLLYIVLCGLSLMAASCSLRSTNSGMEERERVDSLIALYRDSIFTEPDAMKARFAEVQEGLTDSISYYKLLLFEGLCDYYAGRKDNAEETRKRVLGFCHSHAGCEALEAACYNQRAVIMQFGNQPDSAVFYLQKAYGLLERSDERSDMSDLCINLADMYRLIGNYPLSVTNYRRALFLADSLHIPKNYFAIYTGLAQNYTDLWNFSAANHYFRLAESRLAKGSERERYFFYNSKGNSLYTQKRYKEALPCFLEAKKLAQRFAEPYDEIIVEINLGEIYTLLHESDSAHCYLKQAEAFLAKDPDANRQQLFYLNSLKASLALEEGHLEEASHLLMKPYDKRLIYKPYQLLHFKRLMAYYARCGNFKKAYHYRDIVEAYDDSLRNLRNVNNINEIDERYRQDTTLLQRDVTIARNEAQLLHQKVIIAGTTATLVAFVLVAVLVIWYLRKKNEQRYARQRMKVAELRLENVRNRISPHYLFNVLNSLMPAFRQYPGLKRPLRLLVDVLRGNLLASDRVAVALGEELELVKNYIALRRETNPGTPDIDWQIDRNVPFKTLVPSMIIQIPVENTLKYAFVGFGPEYEKRLSVRIQALSNGLSIQIEDNGCGYHPGIQKETKGGTGTGLKVLFQTLDLLNLKNREKASFTISNIASSTGKHGTLTEIFIPEHYQFKF